MGVRVSFSFLAGAVINIAALSLMVGQAHAQRVERLDSGEAEIRFSGDCVVRYDSSSFRTRSRAQGCSAEEIRRADEAIAVLRTKAGEGDPPEIRIIGDGASEVRFRNGCVVTYNEKESQTRSRAEGCNRDEIRRADDVIALRERDAELTAPPQIIVVENGESEVRLSEGCVIFYNSKGSRVRTRPACRESQIRRADQEIASYRRDQRRDGDAPRLEIVDSDYRKLNSKSFDGRLVGADTKDYTMEAEAGQTMVVDFQPSNSSIHFNVYAPGAPSALFVGSTSGNRFSGEVPASGEYRIHVYSADGARRDDSTSYKIKLELSAPREGVVVRSQDTRIQDARFTTTQFNATTELPCASFRSQPMSQCKAGIVRNGGGEVIIRVFLQGGNERNIFFRNGRISSTDGGDVIQTERRGDLYVVSVGDDERYEIPDLLVTGN